MSTLQSIPRVLSIAGTDPTGGAGIPADIKAISAAGGFAMTAVTAIVAQNTLGVQRIFTPPRDILRAQLDSVTADVELDAIKIGMLGDKDTITEVGEFLRRMDTDIPVVIDPVMVASSGDRLQEPQAARALVDILPLADVLTPNIPELAVLSHVAQGGDLSSSPQPLATRAEALEAARALAASTDSFVVCKGGHLEDADAGNTLIAPDGFRWHTPISRVDTPHTHGTGCSLSSAIATRMGAGESADAAVHWATRWLHEAISHAGELEVGHGHGPVYHFHQLYRLAGLIDA